MATPADELEAKIFRLQADWENIAFTLANTELSVEQKALLEARFASVQDELLRLAGDAP